jgi:hypothetical protein
VKFLLLMYGEAGGAEVGPLRDAARGEAAGAGEWLDGAALAHPALARTVRVRDGVATTTEGPHPGAARDSLAGFWLLDCESMDRAVELAARLPEARAAAVEVVPLMGPTGLEM